MVIHKGINKKNDGRNWEKKVGEIFENIGFSETTRTSRQKFSNMGMRRFCFEPLNQEMQVDVFIRVDKTQWILIECRDRRNKTIKKWLHEIQGRCHDRQTKIRRENPKINACVFGVAATSLKEVDEKVQVVAKDTGISLWHHGIVDYLRVITKGASFQVEDIVLYRCGIRKSKYPVINLQIQKWPQGKEHWFVGFVHPSQIARAAFVYQRGQGFGESAYQRFLKPKRISEIADFVNKGRMFPNSIVIALPESIKIPRVNNTELLTLNIPGDPETLKIIDGQHRFFGALASGKDPKLLCTFVRAEDLDQAVMFATVNGKQVTVSKSQLVALFGIPQFAAKIAAGVNERDRKKIELEETAYRTLERLNKIVPLKDSLNFYPGRPSDPQIPFKTIYDAIVLIARVENSGFSSLPGKPKEKGRLFGNRLAKFLSLIEQLVGKSDFLSKKVWYQPTMLSAIIRTYPVCRQECICREPNQRWLRDKQKNWEKWKPDPVQYRGAGNIKILAIEISKRLGIDRNVYATILK